MTSTAPFGDVLLIGQLLLGAVVCVCVGVGIAVALALGAYKRTTRPGRRYPAAPALPASDLRVIGGHRVTSDERWGRAA